MVSLILLGMAALATAESSTVSLFLFGADSQSLVASIAGSDSTATTYVVACANSAAVTSLGAAESAAVAAITGAAATTVAASPAPDTTDCGFPTPFTVIEGPSTVQYAFTVEDYGAGSVDCALSGSFYATCTVSASGQGAALSSDTGALATGAAASTGLQASGDFVTTTLRGTDAHNAYLPVVVTAGSATAKPVSATSTGTGSTTSTGSSKSGTSTGSSTGTSTGTSSAAAKSTNGAVAAAPVLGAGMLGAFGVAVAGALL